MNIDYELLDKQIKELINIRFGEYVMPQPQKNALDGVIELLEAMLYKKEKKDG